MGEAPIYFLVNEKLRLNSHHLFAAAQKGCKGENWIKLLVLIYDSSLDIHTLIDSKLLIPSIT